jgi:hypothetical protein
MDNIIGTAFPYLVKHDHIWLSTTIIVGVALPYLAKHDHIWLSLIIFG